MKFKSNSKSDTSLKDSTTISPDNLIKDKCEKVIQVVHRKQLQDINQKLKRTPKASYIRQNSKRTPIRNIMNDKNAYNSDEQLLLVSSKSEKHAINCDIQLADISEKIETYRTYKLKIDNIYEHYNVKTFY